jgi:deoxyribonuclease-4
MIGSNVPTIDGFHTGFAWGDKWGCECIQIYITLSRRWEVPELNQEEITEFNTAWKNSSVKQVVAHVPFLVNLASPNKEIWQKSIVRLITEISRAERLGVPFLVLHPGSYGNLTRREGIKRVTQALDIVFRGFDKLSVKILLETMAGQGTMLGSSFEEIAEILEKATSSESLGVCFDTGHVFMAGYDLRSYEGYESVLREFDKLVSLKKIGCFHLNDSKTRLGSRNDRHACIGEGELGLQVFHALLLDQRFSKTPKILEIPERDKRSKDNLELLRKLSQTSEPLPKERYTPTQLTLTEKGR